MVSSFESNKSKSIASLPWKTSNNSKKEYSTSDKQKKNKIAQGSLATVARTTNMYNFFFLSLLFSIMLVSLWWSHVLLVTIREAVRLMIYLANRQIVISLEFCAFIMFRIRTESHRFMNKVNGNFISFHANIRTLSIVFTLDDVFYWLWLMRRKKVIRFWLFRDGNTRWRYYLLEFYYLVWLCRKKF